MNCSKHTDKEAVGACVACGDLICEDCLVKINNKNYCKECVVKLKEETNYNDTQNKINKAKDSQYGINLFLAVICIILSLTLILGNVKYLGLISVSNLILFPSMIPSVILIFSCINIIKAKQYSKNKTVIILNTVAIIMAILLSVVYFSRWGSFGISASIFIRLLIINIITFKIARK